MRYLELKKEEMEVLEHLHQNCPNNTVRKRSQCLVLSHQRHKIKDLTSIFKVSRRTIERWFDSWAAIGVDSLAISEGRGPKTLLKDYSEEVAKQLELYNRNLKNVLIYFEEQHNSIICKKKLQNFLKVTGL